MLSPDFINSDYINNIEIKVAFEKYEKGKAIVVPIYIRYCDWLNSAIRLFQANPKKEGKLKPIKAFKDRDEAFLIVVLN